MTAVHLDKIDNFSRYRLENEFLSISVLPCLGAKISSLWDRSTGREWMWRPPGQTRFAPLETGMPFEKSSLVGADECIPTIAPCSWRGLELTDHGEVWSEGWEIDPQELKQNRIVTRVKLPISPLSLCRSVSLDARTVSLDYELTSLADRPFEYIWAFHPLLALREGDLLTLPEDCRKVRTEFAEGCPMGQRGDAWNWPRPMEGMRLDQLDLGGPARAFKLFSDPLNEGKVTVSNDRTGDKLLFEFNVAEIDTVGIWINRGGWNGYEHFAIEPTTGAPDALDLAVQDWKRYSVIEPEETKQWSFQITVGSENHAA